MPAMVNSSPSLSDNITNVIAGMARSYMFSEKDCELTERLQHHLGRQRKQQYGKSAA